MLDEREGEVPAEQLDQAFNRKPVRQRIAIVAAGPVANFLLAILFFWCIALLGTQQVRPVIGAVEPDSLAASAGLRAGQEIVAVDGEATPGWSAVNLQLVRRLGESGTVEVQVREEGASLVSTRQLVLRDWLRGVDEPEPLASLGIRPWRPAAEPVVSELDPQGPAQAAGVRLGDRLLALGELQIDDWQQVVDWLREHPAEQVTLRIARA